MSDTPAHRLAASRRFLTQEDVDDLIDIAVGLPLNANVVDLGAGTGTTAIAMLQTRPDIHVWTYDISAEAVDWARLNIVGFLDTIALEHWTGHVSDASRAARFFQSPVHALLHDASHEEEDVFENVYEWYEKLVTGAMIWVHDYLPMPGAEETYPGVKTAVDRLRSEHRMAFSVFSPFATGIGWMGRKE